MIKKGTNELPPPAGLGVEAKHLWAEVTALYALRPDDVRMLHDACKTVDIIEELEAKRPTRDLMVKGSHGQLMIHPLIRELSVQRNVLRAQLKQLGLKDLSSSDGKELPGGGDTSTSARRAAMQRWGRRG